MDSAIGVFIDSANRDAAGCCLGVVVVRARDVGAVEQGAECQEPCIGCLPRC